MIVFPNSKINIGLYITEKRPDGFHNLETIFYPIPLTDALEIIKDDTALSKSSIQFSQSGSLLSLPEEENLVIKACRLIQRDFSALPPLKIHLHKNIPTGAGLGGGSSDAAFTLKLLNNQFNLGLSDADLMDYAAKLGSDCSFFISNKPALGTGRGEQLENIQLDLKAYQFLVIYPNIHIPTSVAFMGCRPQSPGINLKDVIMGPVTEWKNSLSNDFETSIFSNYPEIKKIKDSLYNLGALYASMSGSGSSVYGIFNALPDIKSYFPDNYQCFIL